MNDILFLDKDLRDFLAQDRLRTLLLSCRAGDLVLPSKLMMAQAQQSETLVVMGVGLCPNAGEWVDEIVAAVSADLDLARATLVGGGEQARSFPPLPLAALDVRLNAADRIEQIIRHVGDCAGYEEEVVWVLLPTNCEDRQGYRDAVRGLLEDHAWMDGHRFVLWDDAEQPELASLALSLGSDRCVVRDIDLSPARQLDALATLATDPGSAEGPRREAMFQLAAVDYAYQRYDEALKKYRWVYATSDEQESATRTMCLQGAGDIAMRRQDPKLALDYYRSALGTALAAEVKPSAVIQPVLIGAGQACVQLGQLTEAEGYFEYGNLVAANNLNAFAKADAIELRARAQHQAALSGASEKIQEALASYAACKKVCCEFGYEQRWREASEWEIKFLDALGHGSEARKAQVELDEGFETATQRHLATQAERSPA